MRFVMAVALLAAVLGGCATKPQFPVSLADNALGPQLGRVGVAMAPLPKPTTFFPGADCLLCLAAAELNGARLSGHAATLPLEDLPQLKQQVAEKLRKKGLDVLVIDEPLDVDKLPDRSTDGDNIARKDFAAVGMKYKLDRLVVLQVRQLGFQRMYAAYVPTGDPRAIVQGTGFMLDLKTHRYDWYRPVHVTRAAEGGWDEPPKYPGLTNAYFQALELGKDTLVRPFD